MATSSTYCSTFLILLLISSGSALDPVLQKAEESVTEVNDVTSTPKSDNIEEDEKLRKHLPLLIVFSAMALTSILLATAMCHRHRKLRRDARKRAKQHKQSASVSSNNLKLMDMFNSHNFQEAYMNISKPLFTNSSNPYAVNAHTSLDGYEQSVSLHSLIPTDNQPRNVEPDHPPPPKSAWIDDANDDVVVPQSLPCSPCAHASVYTPDKARPAAPKTAWSDNTSSSSCIINMDDDEEPNSECQPQQEYEQCYTTPVTPFHWLSDGKI